MTEKDQKKAAAAFAKEWAGQGDEKQHTHRFWIGFLQKVLGVDDADEHIQFENNKVSDETLKFYSDNNVSTVALNSFAAHRSESFKREVFRKELDKHLKQQLPENGFEIAGMISQNTAMHLSETELKNFFKRYIKGIALRFRDNGDLAIEIPS